MSDDDRITYDQYFELSGKKRKGKPLNKMG